MATNATKQETLEVFTVNDRSDGQGGTKAWWTRIGSAWKNRDGSLNIKLDALPVNGTIQVRRAQDDNNKQSAQRQTQTRVVREREPGDDGHGGVM